MTNIVIIGSIVTVSVYYYYCCTFIGFDRRRSQLKRSNRTPVKINDRCNTYYKGTYRFWPNVLTPIYPVVSKIV